MSHERSVGSPHEIPNENLVCEGAYYMQYQLNAPLHYSFPLITHAAHELLVLAHYVARHEL
jgi:hypothetical protein